MWCIHSCINLRIGNYGISTNNGDDDNKKWWWGMQSRSVGTNIHIHVHLEGWIFLCNLIATFCIMSSLTHTRSIYQVGINYRMFRNNTTLHLDRFLWGITFLLKGTYFILGYYLCEDGSTKSNEPFQKPNHHTSVWWKISHAAANQNSKL